MPAPGPEHGVIRGFEAAVSTILGAIMSTIFAIFAQLMGQEAAEFLSMYWLAYLLINALADIASLLATMEAANYWPYAYFIGRLIGLMYAIMIVSAAGFSTITLWISLFVLMGVFMIRVWKLAQREAWRRW